MLTCCERVWSSLRKEVLVDLERRFGKKLQHEFLLSCLIYDFIFVQCLISPLFVATWRGTWENEDTILDKFFFHGDMKASAALALGMGTFISGVIVFLQHEIRQFALSGSRFRFFLVSRLYTFFRFSFDVLTWKGIWGFWDFIIGSNWSVALINMFLPSIFLLACGCFRTTHSAPIGLGMDRPNSCMVVPTAFSSTMNDNFLRRLSDSVMTSLFSASSICSFYGVWVVQDLLLGDVGRETDDPVRGKNGAISYGFGVACCIVAFMLQFLCLQLDRTQDSDDVEPNKFSEENSGTHLSRFLYRFRTRPFLNLLAYDILLIIAQFGNVSIFRGLWNMIDAFVWPDHVHMSRIVCQFVGMFYIMLLYSGTSLHGGIGHETNRKKDGLLLPNFFITYLLATKVDTSKADDVKEEAENRPDMENNNTTFETFVKFENYEKFEPYETFDKFESYDGPDNYVGF